MAKLDIHFPTGLIGHAGLSPDRPLLVGTHPQCDVVLTDAHVASVHCRIFWKRDGYWVEAAPDADDIELNGRLVRTAPLVSRDTLLLGETRLVIDTAGTAEAVPTTAGKQGGGVRSGEASPYSDLWAAIDRGEAGELGPPVRMRSSRGRWWNRFKRATVAKGDAEAAPPGQERLLRSPLILGLSVTLLVLAVTGLVFWIVFAQVGGRRHYDRALDSMQEGLYADAARRFDRFLEDYPDHELAENARVLRALCQVRRFSDGTAASPTQAVREAARMVDQVGQLPAFAPVQSQLVEILGRMVQTLSAQAQSGTDKEAYARAQEALRLLETLAGPEEDDGQKLHQSLSVATSAIQKADRLERTLQKMQRSIDAGDPLSAYRRRDQLVRQYPDLAAEERLREHLRRATELERAAITWQPGRPVQRPLDPQADSSPRSASPADAHGNALHYTSAPLLQAGALPDEPQNPVRARTSFVVGSSDRIARQPPIGDADGPVVFAIADGALYAVDAVRGTVLWRRVVGYDVPSLPTLIVDTSGTRALLSDPRRNELLLVEARTGRLVWRQQFGEVFDTAPLVHEGRIFLATRGGHLVVLDMQTGRVEGHVSFPQPLAHTPVLGAGGTRLYVAAQYASLYALSAGSLECEGVYYLGHPTDSIRTKPLSVGEFLIVAEDHTLHGSRLRVLDASSADGTGPVQDVTLEGWVTQSPAESGRFVWVATDAGRLYSFQLSPARPSSPLALVAESDHPDESGIEQFLFPWSEQECFTAGAELRRYELSVKQANLGIDWTNRRGGVPTQALQRQGNVLFAARRLSGAAGILLSAIDTRSNSPLWEIQLAGGFAAVLVDGAAAPPIVVTQSGHGFRWTHEAAKQTGVVSEPFLAIKELWHDAPELVYDARRETCVLGTGDGGRELLVWTRRDGRLEPAPHWIELPVAASAAPAALGQGILIPAADQRLYLLDANSGWQLAIPFQPPLDAQQPLRWSNPVVSQSGAIVAADTSGRLFRLEVAHEPFDYVAAVRSRSLDHAIVSPLVALDGQVCFIDSVHNLQVVSSADLSSVAVWQLAGDAPAAGPWVVGDYLVVESQGREVVCLDRDGALLWRKPFEDLHRAGPPLLHRGALCFVGADGTVFAVRPQDGEELWRLDVQEPLAAGLVMPDKELVVVSDDGTFNTLAVPAASP